MSYQVETITGADVAAARKLHKLTRPQLSELAGLGGRSTSRLTNIERLESWKPGDREKLVDALNRLDGGADGGSVVPEGVAAELGATDDGRVVYLLDPDLDEPPELDGDPEVAALGYVWTEQTEARAEHPADVGPRAVGEHALAATLPPPDVAHVPSYERAGYALSNSLVQAWKRCRRKWWLSWFRDLALQTERYVGVRSTGDRIHRALAAYYVPEGQVRVDPRDALERAVVEDWTQIDALARAREADEDQVAALAEEFAKSTNLERAMVEGYVQWLQETGEDSDLEVVGSEKALTVELETPLGRPVLAIGLLDVRTVSRKNGTRRFLDHKSVQELTSPPLTLQGDEQMLHYHLLEWLGEPDNEARCEGALYNMLRRVKRTAQAKPPFYDRVSIEHNLHELENYRTQLLGAADEVLTAVQRLERGESHQAVAYPSKRPSCRYDCDFFAVCGLLDDGSRAEDMLGALYHRVDPHDRYLQRDGVSL